MSEDVIKPLNEVVMSGFITQGPKVEEFEKALQTYFDYPYILTLNSATSGLTMAIRMIKDQLGLGDDAEVLSCPLTCMATNLPIVANGLKIKWVDVDPDTCNISLDDLEKKLSPTTRIIQLVHWGGVPVDMHSLNDILDRCEDRLGFRPVVVEDCAHSFGAEYDGQLVGTMGNYAVFSLQAIKHLTTGDGGLIFLPDEEAYNKAKLLRWYGIDRDKRNYNRKDLRLESDVAEWGYKYHMNDINATIGLHNLPHIPGNLEKIRDRAWQWSQALLSKEFDGFVELFDKPSFVNAAHWLYTIKIKGGRKLEFIEFMKERGVMVSQVHQRNDVHTCFEEFKTPLPNLDALEKEMVCIPCGWWTSKADVHEMLDYMRDFFGIKRKGFVNVLDQTVETPSYEKNADLAKILSDHADVHYTVKCGPNGDIYNVASYNLSNPRYQKYCVNGSGDLPGWYSTTHFCTGKDSGYNDGELVNPEYIRQQSQKVQEICSKLRSGYISAIHCPEGYYEFNDIVDRDSGADNEIFTTFMTNVDDNSNSKNDGNHVLTGYSLYDSTVVDQLEYEVTHYGKSQKNFSSMLEFEGFDFVGVHLPGHDTQFNQPVLTDFFTQLFNDSNLTFDDPMLLSGDWNTTPDRVAHIVQKTIPDHLEYETLDPGYFTHVNPNMAAVTYDHGLVIRKKGSTDVTFEIMKEPLLESSKALVKCINETLI